jgi:hypothetical protein
MGAIIPDFALKKDNYSGVGQCRSVKLITRKVSIIR